jgi:hypothetical protein
MKPAAGQLHRPGGARCTLGASAGQVASRTPASAVLYLNDVRCSSSEAVRARAGCQGRAIGRTTRVSKKVGIEALKSPVIGEILPDLRGPERYYLVKNHRRALDHPDGASTSDGSGVAEESPPLVAAAGPGGARNIASVRRVRARAVRAATRLGASNPSTCCVAERRRGEQDPWLVRVEAKAARRNISSDLRDDCRGRSYGSATDSGDHDPGVAIGGWLQSMSGVARATTAAEQVPVSDRDPRRRRGRPTKARVPVSNESERSTGRVAPPPSQRLSQVVEPM